MYIIACRAHFCHLPGLGQVGHSQRETSRSNDTHNRGPCLALVRQVTPQEEPVEVLGPWTEAQCGQVPSPPAIPNAPLIPPYILPCPLTPLEAQCPLCHLYPFCCMSNYTSCQLPNTPPDALDTLLMAPRSPQCPLYPFWPLSTYTPCKPPIPLTPPTLPDTP